MPIFIGDATSNFIRRCRIRAVIRPRIVPEDVVVHDNGGSRARPRIRADEIFSVLRAAEVARRIAIFERQRICSLALHEGDGASRLARQFRRIHVEIVREVDLPAKAVIAQRQHRIPARNVIVQFKVVLIEILDAMNRDAFAAHVQHIVVDSIVGAVVTVN